MAKIIKQDTDGTKGLLALGEFGLDNYPAGGDQGRVYVGNGAANIALAKKSEVDNITGGTSQINVPTIVSPTTGAVDTEVAVAIVGSAYTTSDTYTGSHTSSIAEFATDSGFTNIVSTITVGLETLTASGLNASTVYYVRIKYISGDFSSEWSDTVNFTTMAAGIVTPLITSPTNGQNDLGDNPTVTVSAYSVFGRSETQTGLTVRVYSDAGLTTLVREITNTATNATTVELGSLAESTTYYLVSLYTSASYTSGLSTVSSFTTKSAFAATYGINWDQTNDTYVRTGDAASWTPFTQFDTAPGNVEGTKGTQGLDDFSVNETVHKYMRRCVLNADGTVNYYLDANDSTLKEDGATPSVLDGTDGNVMVQIPKFYYKYNYNTTTGVVHEHTVSLLPIDGGTVHPAFVQNGVEKDFRYYPAYQGSNVGGKLMSVSGNYVDANLTRDAYRTLAEANGAGWHVTDWLLYEAVVLLMVIEYGSFNLQSAFGEGRTCLTGGSWADSSYYGIHGNSNSDGNFSNNNQEGANASSRIDADLAAADLIYMTYRGIENLWGNVYLFLDGINVNNHIVYLNDDPATFADDTTTNYTQDVTMASSNGYTSELANSSNGFFPTAVTGSTSTHTGDYYYQSTGWRVVLVGSAASDGLSAGPLFLRAYDASTYDYVYFGSAVSF